MNKHQRAEIKKILLAQTDSSVDDLRLRRLNETLARIDADNFGECFKCGQDIQFTVLRTWPERVICDNCLEGAKG
jgi:RNA polymerase-binding transcription factor DksA